MFDNPLDPSSYATYSGQKPAADFVRPTANVSMMPSRNVVFWYVGVMTSLATGSGPCQVAPPSVDQTRLMSLWARPWAIGFRVVVVQIVPSGATCGSR